MNNKTIIKGLSITLISIINYFSAFPAFGQQTSCSSYWTNPNTGQIECFGVNSNGNFGVINENSKPNDPFENAKTSLEFACVTIWNNEKDKISYDSHSYNKLEQSYEECKLAQENLREQLPRDEKREPEMTVERRYGNDYEMCVTWMWMNGIYIDDNVRSKCRGY